MIIFYKYLGIILIPIIKINLFFRIYKKKENKKRVQERYGISSIKRPKGELIWIHAASVGEFKSTDLLINTFYKNYNILITTTTLSAANYAKKQYGNKIIHQFAPLDISLWIEKFLKKWKPKLVIWIESDLWPMTLKILKQKKIKAMLINVRMSPNSFEKWKLAKYFYRQMTDCFVKIYAQSEIDRKRIQKLTNRNINFIGNLKLSSNLKNKQNNKSEKLKFFKNKKILMLSSTHENEEKIFIPVIKNILCKINNLKIIIAPRHIGRAKEILFDFKKNNISTTVLNNNINLKHDVFIINTFGNLPAYFNIADVVFLGGSFVNKGGHNPIEPAINKCVILTGPHIFNWQNIYEYMIDSKACFLSNDILELEKKIISIFKNNKKMLEIKKRTLKSSKIDFFNSNLLITSIKKIMRTSNC